MNVVGMTAGDGNFEDGYQTPNGGTTETPDVPSGPAFGDNKIEYGKNDPDLNHSGVIPEGGTYYTDIVACDRCYQIPNSVEDTSVGGIKKTCDCGNTSFNPTILNEGESFPDTVSPYDIYIYNGYEYRFNQYYLEYSWRERNNMDGWSALYIGRNKTPEPILENINGKNIVSLEGTFYQTGIEVAPKIPSTVQYMCETFYLCKSLKDVSNVVIPEGIKDISVCFGNCTALEVGPLTINGNPTDYSVCFLDCLTEIIWDENGDWAGEKLMIDVIGSCDYIDEIIAETSYGY